jgi:hypothetical protein
MEALAGSHPRVINVSALDVTCARAFVETVEKRWLAIAENAPTKSAAMIVLPAIGLLDPFPNTVDFHNQSPSANRCLHHTHSRRPRNINRHEFVKKIRGLEGPPFCHSGA